MDFRADADLAPLTPTDCYQLITSQQYELAKFDCLNFPALKLIIVTQQRHPTNHIMGEYRARENQ
jgi:hypothetical protein